MSMRSSKLQRDHAENCDDTHHLLGLLFNEFKNKSCLSLTVLHILSRRTPVRFDLLVR